jgi:hypothetical protein
MDKRVVRNWVRVGIGAGVVACVTYPLTLFVPMPRFLQTTVALTFGPALGFASVGLYHFLRLHRDSVWAQIGAISNLLAGTLVTTMLSVQLAVAYQREDYFAGPEPDESVRTIVRWVWDVILGLDIAWDVFIGLGTLMFGIAMLGHPRLGRIIGWIGILIAGVGVLGFNFYTLPTPPADAGLVDAGPLCGLWYLAVVILIWRSRRWVDGQLESGV